MATKILEEDIFEDILGPIPKPKKNALAENVFEDILGPLPKRPILSEKIFEDILGPIPEIKPTVERPPIPKILPIKPKPIIPELRALTPEIEARYPFRYEIPEKEVFKKRVELLTDKIFKEATGIEPEEAIRAEKRLENLMARMPRLGYAFAFPLISLGFEALQQAKNIIVPLIKKEKYSPFETKILSELLPEKTPIPIKIGVGIAEWLGEVALMGGLANIAKRGLLTKTIKEIGFKLEKAGYRPERPIEITKEAIKEAVKGTTLEREAIRYLKAKSAVIKPKYKLPTPEKAIVPTKPITPIKPEIPTPKFEIGQKVVDIRGKEGVIQTITPDPETGITFYGVKFPELPRLAQLSEKLIKPIEVTPIPKVKLPILTPKAKAIHRVIKEYMGGGWSIRDTRAMREGEIPEILRRMGREDLIPFISELKPIPEKFTNLDPIKIMDDVYNTVEVRGEKTTVENLMNEFNARDIKVGNFAKALNLPEKYRKTFNIPIKLREGEKTAAFVGGEIHINPMDAINGIPRDTLRHEIEHAYQVMSAGITTEKSAVMSGLFEKINLAPKVWSPFKIREYLNKHPYVIKGKIKPGEVEDIYNKAIIHLQKIKKPIEKPKIKPIIPPPKPEEISKAFKEEQKLKGLFVSEEQRKALWVNAPWVAKVHAHGIHWSDLTKEQQEAVKLWTQQKKRGLPPEIRIEKPKPQPITIPKIQPPEEKPPTLKDLELEQGYQAGLQRIKRKQAKGQIVLPLKVIPQEITTSEGKIEKENFMQHLKKAITTIIDEFTFYRDAPPELRNAIRIELIGGLSKIKDDVYNKTAIHLFGGLNSKEIQSAVELIFARNQLSRVKIGKGDPRLSVEEAEKILNDIEKKITNPEVIEAANRWKELADREFAELVERGLLSAEDKIEDYAPIYVEDYTSEWIFHKGIPARLKRPFRGYVKPAIGTTKEYKKDVEALLGHLLQVRYDNLIDDFLNKWATKYDLLRELPKEKQIELFGSYLAFGKYPTPLSPKPGRIYVIDGKRYRAYNPKIPFSRQIFPFVLEDERVLKALGKYSKTYLLPEKIYNIFMRFSEHGGVYSKYIYLINKATSYWKSMAILSRFPAFNINNLIGDTWMALIQSPEPFKILANIHPALTYLIKSPLKYNPEEKEFHKFIIDNSILDSAFISAELPLIKKSTNPLLYIFRKSLKISEFREQIMRTAQAYYFFKEMKQNKGEFIRDYYSWIDTKDLPLEQALGKIARETLVDYLSISKLYKQLIRGLLMPFGRWFLKASALMAKFHKHKPFKAILGFLFAPLVAALWNYSKHRELEEQLPESVRNRTHIVLGETKEGNIRTLTLQLPQDFLIGTKIYSIAVSEAFKVMNGEKTIEEAAKDTLKEWGIREKEGITYLQFVIIRFISGLISGIDPYDKQPIYPMDIRKMSQISIAYHRGLYLLKCSIPFLTVTLREFSKKGAITKEELIKEYLGLPALGIRDFTKKAEIVLPDKGKIDYELYRDLEEMMQKEAAILLSIEEDFIVSGLDPKEFYTSERFIRHLEKLRDLYKDKWDKEIEESLSKRIKTNIENDPVVLEKWATNNYERAKTSEEKRYWNEIIIKLRKLKLLEKIKRLPKTVR